MMKKIGLLILVILGLSSLSLSQAPPVEAPAPSPKAITYSPDPIHQVECSWENYSFVFSYKAHYLRLRPFVIYGGEYYGLQKILNYLRAHYPEITFREVLQKLRRAIHYGFNITQLPSQVAQNLDYVGFRLVDLNFPLSWLELQDKHIFIDGELHKIQVIRIPRAQLTLSFEDLLPQGYSIQAVNRTHVLIGEVRGRTDLSIDPIVYSGSYIEDSTPSTEESPENMEALYQADQGGNLSLFSEDSGYHYTVSEDSGAQTTETGASNNATADDMNLVPIDSTTDCYYWGYDETWGGFALNVTTPGVYVASLIWEYRKAFPPSWMSFGFTVTDNTDGFQTGGVNTITWDLASIQDYWASYSVNGITAYWVRARVSGFTNCTTQPLGGQSWILKDVDTQPQPHIQDDLEVFLNVKTYTAPSGSVRIQGTDGEDNSVSEWLSVSGTGVVNASNRYKTISSEGLWLSGNFSTELYQRTWDVIGKGVLYPGYCYSWDLYTAIRIGNGSSSTFFEETNCVFLFRYSQDPDYFSNFMVRSGATLHLGKLSHPATKGVYGSAVQFYTLQDYYGIRSEAGSSVYLYGVQFSGYPSSSVAYLLQGDENRLYGCSVMGVSEYTPSMAVLNADIYNLQMSQGVFGSSAGATNGTIRKIQISGPLCLSLEWGYGVSLRDLEAPEQPCFFYQAGNSEDSYLTDVVVKNYSYSSGWDPSTAEIYNRYSFNLNVSGADTGQALSGATVLISHYGQGGGTDYSGTIPSNGSIPEQLLIQGYWNQTGMATLYDRNPFHIKISKDGYRTYEANFTLDEPIKWEVALLKYEEPSQGPYFSAHRIDYGSFSLGIQVPKELHPGFFDYVNNRVPLQIDLRLENYQIRSREFQLSYELREGDGELRLSGSELLDVEAGEYELVSLSLVEPFSKRAPPRNYTLSLTVEVGERKYSSVEWPIRISHDPWNSILYTGAFFTAVVGVLILGYGLYHYWPRIRKEAKSYYG